MVPNCVEDFFHLELHIQIVEAEKSNTEFFRMLLSFFVDIITIGGGHPPMQTALRFGHGMVPDRRDQSSSTTGSKRPGARITSLAFLPTSYLSGLRVVPCHGVVAL